MNPLVLLPLLQLLGGAVGALPSAPASAAETAKPAAGPDPALLAALVALAQRPSDPPIEMKLPRAAAWIATFVVGGFFAVLFSIVGLLLFGHGVIDGAPLAALAVLCFGFGVLSSKFGTVVDFLFGSSFGSRLKDARRQEAPGSPIILPAPTTPAEPVTPPAEPAPGEMGPSEPHRAVEGIGRSTDPSTASLRADVPYDGRPASIRYNNPGAQYPSARAATFGQTGYGVIGGGHKIARFPHPVNGAAANFDLLSRGYTGMTVAEAGDKWTGGNGHGIPGYDDGAVLTTEMIANPAKAIPIMRAIAQREAGKEYPLSDAEWQIAHAMFLADSADAYLNAPQGMVNAKPTDLAAAIVAAMRNKGYALDTKPGEVNIAYVEGLNEDGTINDDAPDRWNDLRCVIGFDGDKPVMLGKWVATTEPGRYYTDNPVNPGGAARIAFGQYTAWRVGMHRGDHEALVQRGPVTVARDLNKDMIRTGDARDTGDNFGINQHGPSGTDEAPETVGKYSAGCLVGKTMAGHRAFMGIVKQDPRFVADPDFLFRTAVLAEKDVVAA